MADCPWYVTAHAVRRFAARARWGGGFDDASDLLIELCAEVWQRYQRNLTLRPDPTHTGAYQYRGPGPHRLTIIVAPEARPEGPKWQVVDVIRVERTDRLRPAR